jgi:hypothetical protein
MGNGRTYWLAASLTGISLEMNCLMSSSDMSIAVSKVKCGESCRVVLCVQIDWAKAA